MPATTKRPPRKAAAKKAGTKGPESGAKPSAAKPAKPAQAKAPAAKAKPARKRAAGAQAAKASPSPSPSPAAQREERREERQAPSFRDSVRLAEEMAETNARAAGVLREAASRAARQDPYDPSRRDPLNVTEAAGEVARALVSDPVALMRLQSGMWEDFTRLFAQTAARLGGAEEPGEPIAAPSPTDRRFRHPAWAENPALDFVKQSYLLMARWMDRAVEEAPGVDEAVRRRALFHTDQLIAAMAPTNVPGLNPEVVEETLRTKGENWQRGARNFLEDLERGHGELAIRQADLDAFKVGENVATTPGKVVFQNKLIQLVQYAPSTAEVAERPLLIFPPWINKFYILDLQPDNSFIRWAVDQGRTVMVVSWVNPGPELKDVSFEDYMIEGVFAALDAGKKATGAERFDAIGYCIGGTLLACALAYMARTGDERIATATFFTAQTDFSEAGDLKVFVDDHQLAAMERQIDQAGGVLEGTAMARTFDMLRPNDLIWAAFVDNYYLGKEAKKFDLLSWNADTTRLTKASHLFYLRAFYRDNALAEGTLELLGEPIRLQDIRIPAFFQAGEKDHIAPPGSVFRSAALFGGEARFMLAGSGHIAGVVNPPSKRKYHYRSSDALPGRDARTLEEWTEGAALHEHSWWPYWDRWLTEHSPGRVPARVPGDGELEPIEDAPGSYVRVRSD
jgi:polyhydroxyalkanoate synthase